MNSICRFEARKRHARLIGWISLRAGSADHLLVPKRGTHFCTRNTPSGVILAPETSFIWPAGHDPSSTRMRWPSRKLTMSCSRDTCSAKAEAVTPANVIPPSSSHEKNLLYEKLMFSVPALSLALDLQSVRTDMIWNIPRAVFGLVEIVAEHTDRDDKRGDDEEENIAIAGHPCLHGATLAPHCTGMVAILKANRKGTK
jgi:hypothetical protein